MKGSYIFTWGHLHLEINLQLIVVTFAIEIIMCIIQGGEEEESQYFFDIHSETKNLLIIDRKMQQKYILMLCTYTCRPGINSAIRLHPKADYILGISYLESTKFYIV